MKNNTNLIAIMVAVIAGAIGFFGGMQYQKSQRGSFGASGARMMSNFGQDGQGQRGPGGRFGNGSGAVVGEVTNIDSTSMTVKLRDGSSKIVILSQTTSINKQATGTKDDLKTGTTVAAFGTPNSDGSVTAQSVQLNPVMRFPNASGTPSAK